MFLNSRARLALKKNRKPKEDRRSSPRYDAPVLIQQEDGGWETRYGVLSLEGCDFESSRRLRVGQSLELRLVLVGMGRVLSVRGRILRVIPLLPTGQSARAAVRFENLPFDIERLLARWLDMLTGAYSLTLAA